MLTDLKSMTVRELDKEWKRLDSERSELAIALRATEKQLDIYQYKSGSAASKKSESLKDEQMQLQRKMEPLNNTLNAIVLEISSRLSSKCLE